MSFFDFDFEGPVERLGIGRTKQVFYKVLFLPPELESQLPFEQHPRLRVVGEIADVPVRGAWQPVGDGRRYFIVSPKVLSATDAGLGDFVEIRFSIDDQDYVEMPDGLREALDQDFALAEAWAALTPGKQRFHAHRVLSAKTAPTISKRVAEIRSLLLG